MNKSRLLALIAMGVLLASTQFASAVTITVDGTNYDVSVLVTSYNANLALLQNQPWWDADGGSDAAIAAVDVASFFGLPNSIGGVSTGPLFLWPGAGVGVSFIAYNSFGGTSAGPLDASNNYTFAIATPSNNIPDAGSSALLFALSVTALFGASCLRSFRSA
jgi:hypothetical protein